MKRVLFVCLGNICRSPAAEGIFKKLVERAGLADRIEIDSAGTSGYHDGEPADARMIYHAKERGYELTTLSRAFVAPDDFEKFDLILTMDQSNFANVTSLDKQLRYQHKVQPIVKFCQIHSVNEVPDPYYEGVEGFRVVLDILEDACENLLVHVQKELS